MAANEVSAAQIHGCCVKSQKTKKIQAIELQESMSRLSKPSFMNMNPETAKAFENFTVSIKKDKSQLKPSQNTDPEKRILSLSNRPSLTRHSSRGKLANRTQRLHGGNRNLNLQGTLTTRDQDMNKENNQQFMLSSSPMMFSARN